MTQINPLTGALVAGSAVQQRALDSKDRQIRRAQNLTRNSALQGDTLEHQVESAEAVTPAHEHDTEDPRKRRQQGKKSGAQEPQQQDEPPRLDVTA